MILPTIHSNGTSKESLLKGIAEASCALELACEKLEAIGPNGRDYYPQGPDAYYKAASAHVNLLTRLQAIKTELDEYHMAVDQI